MFFRRTRLNWYDLVFVGLAFVVVYPDKVAEWLTEHMGIEPGWLPVILIEGAAIALIALATILLMPHHPRLEWWHPAFHVGIVAGVRALHALVTSWFGFGD
jgi:hypothetical protein